MPSSASITARIDEETRDSLENLARATRRSKSWLVAEAVRAYVAEQAWQVEAIRQGLAEAEAGNFASDAEVEAVFAKAGRPLVKVTALGAPEAGQVKRLGFMAGQIAVPDDFDRMGSDEIAKLFGGEA